MNTHVFEVVLAGVTALLGLVVTLLAWFGNKLYEDVKEQRRDHGLLRDDHSDFRVIVARDYATKDDVVAIHAKLDRILDKLEHKADKFEHHKAGSS